MTPYTRYLAWKETIESELELKRPKTLSDIVENQTSEFVRSRRAVKQVDGITPKIESLPPVTPKT